MGDATRVEVGDRVKKGGGQTPPPSASSTKNTIILKGESPVCVPSCLWSGLLTSCLVNYLSSCAALSLSFLAGELIGCQIAHSKCILLPSCLACQLPSCQQPCWLNLKLPNRSVSSSVSIIEEGRAASKSPH